MSRPVSPLTDVRPLYKPHTHVGYHCCQIIPTFITETLTMFNGEDVPHAPPPALTAALGVLAAQPLPEGPQRKVAIQLTMQSAATARTHRIHSAVVSALPAHPPGSPVFSAQPTTAVPREAKFLVYDLDGATDYQESEQTPPEYVLALKPDALLQEPSSAWPTHAQKAKETAAKVYRFYKEIFGRDSIDGKGMDIISCVRLRSNQITFDFSTGFPVPIYAVDSRGKRIKIPENNAFWDGFRMAYGEGDGIVFNDFTASADVIGHELTHGVTQETCGLRYVSQSGALNEHISDVFGVIFRHWDKDMREPTTANWLIGDDCISEDFKRMVTVRRFGYWKALRSMSEPGKAFQVQKGGTQGVDPQPSHMRDYKEYSYDNGGVHINSGIPNKAFHLFALKVGGPSWEIPGKVWYKTITEANFGQLERNDALSTPQREVKDRVATFKQFADASIVAAQALYPDKKQALVDAWTEVGVL